MMQQTTYLPYLSGSGFQVISLPYGDGRLSRVVVLSAAGVALVDPLTTLGMGIAFQPIAAAGTVLGGMTTAMQQPITLQLNRPFFYVIRDNQSGALLFIGVMMNPNGG